MTANNAEGTARMPAPASTDRGEGPRRYAGALAPATAVGFVFLILRIFAVSGYDWNTAFAVSTTLSLSDGLALLFGSLMAGHELVQVLLVAVLPLLIATYLWSSGGRRAAVLLAATLGSVTLVALTASFRLWWLPLATAAVFGAFALIRRLPEKHRLRRLFSLAMASVRLRCPRAMAKCITALGRIRWESCWACPSSCTATDSKSSCGLTGAAGPNCQLVASSNSVSTSCTKKETVPSGR